MGQGPEALPDIDAFGACVEKPGFPHRSQFTGPLAALMENFLGVSADRLVLPPATLLYALSVKRT
jgi:hypothetical protein